MILGSRTLGKKKNKYLEILTYIVRASKTEMFFLLSISFSLGALSQVERFRKTRGASGTDAQ